MTASGWYLGVDVYPTEEPEPRDVDEEALAREDALLDRAGL
jgi:hypothetical protein